MGHKKQKKPSCAAPNAPGAVPLAATPAPEVADVEAATADPRHFFKPEDWWAAAVTALISWVAFFYYMAPEVTLQDSGELVTGAFTFGVPHPPGYPLWALLGYVWSHVLVPFGNPAWRIGLMSVFTGALLVAVLTVTMTRSTRLLLHSLPWSASVDERLLHWIALLTGVSSALLFGFNRGVWLWACVSEMRVMNVCSFVLLACTFFAWTMQPRRRGFLYATILLFAASTANHQTITVMGLPLAVGTFAVEFDQFLAGRRGRAGGAWFGELMSSLASFWELVIAGLFSGMAGLLIFAWLRAPSRGGVWNDASAWQALAAGAAGAVLLAVGHLTRWWTVRRALGCTGLVLLGVCFYLYMPLAASTNPPMNWGYAATKEGFLHAVTRGQYEKLQAAHLFSEEFWLKIKVFTQGLIHQYSLPLVLLGLVSLVALAVWWARWRPRGRSWMIFVWAAFLTTSLGLLTIINPKLDRQEQEITIKFFAPAHGFYAMLIGYGFALLLSVLAWRGRRAGAAAARVLSVGLLALPLITYERNWALCNLRGHDFGYLFGYLMFNPGGGYEPMARDAVLYGGTDPGRFVPTYMIFCESRVRPKDRFRDPNFDRSDVYIITQNALADATYMSYIRDHYDYSRPDADRPETLAAFPAPRRWIFRLGWHLLKRDRTYPPAPIYIPKPDELNLAFQEYVQDVQAGRIPASADLKIEGGRVSVQGVGGVMTINGILARWIFDKNKDKHAFYVEESYVIPWMYPFLRPHGVIMKIEKDPLPSPQENPALWKDIVARDRAYWDKLSAQFMARADFRRNNDAKKSFSKMRSALAGLYVSRGLPSEAEYAFRQSLQLCPESPEANFRLAELYMRQRRYAEARDLIQTYQQLDIYNMSARAFLDNIAAIENDDRRRGELEDAMRGSRLDVNGALELAALYLRMNMDGSFMALTQNLLANSNLPPAVSLSVAQLYGQAKRWDLFTGVMQRYLAAEPHNWKVWIELGYGCFVQNKPEDGFAALSKAVEKGGEMARAALREDARFTPMRQAPLFQALVRESPTAFNFGLPGAP